MTIKKTKIKLIFKSEYETNEYYHGKDFHNPNLKYLTPEKLSEIIKLLIPSDSNKEKIEISLILTNNELIELLNHLAYQ